MNARQDFFKQSEQMFSLYAERKFKEALAVVDQLSLAFPAEAAKTDFWRICLLSVSGDEQGALDAMMLAIGRGSWWSEQQLRSDSDLASLQGDSRFESMVEVCKMQQHNAAANAKPDLMVLKPKGNGPFPLLIALHGRSSSPEQDVSFWESAVDQGWMVAMPQSSQPGSPNSYVWDDETRAMIEINAHYLSLMKHFPIERGHILLGGFSQGAVMAMLLAIDGLVRVRGVIAVSPGGFGLARLEPTIKATHIRRLSTYLVIGGRDIDYTRIKTIPKTLSDAEFACKLEEYPDMGHSFPADFDQTLKRAFEFIG